MKNRKPTYIIGEAGVNHNGNFEIAIELIQEALKANVNAIKFQTFISDACVCKNARLASYQKNSLNENSVETQLEMIKPLELTFQQFRELHKICMTSGIQFLSTPFDMESIKFLSSLQMPFWKIPSGEITNRPYLKKIGSFGQEVILSTGMADLGEIEDALDILQESGTSWNKITLCHCNTEYPTPMKDANLTAMQTMRFAFPGVRIGYSDHTEGIEASIAAVAMGATVIEKHFTLDKNLQGPDHKASLEPDELSNMVRAIRNIEQAMGTGIKKPSPSEKNNISVARKSIVASKAIPKDQSFTDENLTAKRPGNGLSPMYWDKIIGRKAGRDYSEDEPIDS